MQGKLGSQIGLFRRATILKYNDDGTVLIGLDEGGLHQDAQKFVVPIPLSWSGQEGEFIGGYPRRGSSVLVSQGQGGQWFIVSYLTSNNVFANRNSFSLSSSQADLMSVLKPGRAVLQVKDGSRLFLDPEIGIQVGSSTNFAHLNPKKNIISHNFGMALHFTEAHREINGIIKRDLIDNLNRNVLGSTLDSQIYDEALHPIGLDPSSIVSITTIGNNIRNPPLTEHRKLIYEFANSFNFASDQEEISQYIDLKSSTNRLKINRREMRSDTLSLSLESPNQLLESIQGTVVDTFGNILDINHSILPIGKIDTLSLRKNTSKADAFTRIRSQLRKSIAWHLQINTRHGTANEADPSLPPDIKDNSDYSRSESKFTLDIDKEGQFKINIPASSELGNIPLLVRQTNYSNLIASEDSAISPNSFIRNNNNQDIFLKNFASKPAVKLNNSINLDGYQAPIDYLTDQPIQYGTAYHNIAYTCSEFQTKARHLQAGLQLINFHVNNHLNKEYIPLTKIVSETITVAGEQANGGGRSGMFNADGFIMLNVGANTIDRQSMWFDYAGSVIGNVGRDRQGISYATSCDGDVLLQIGGPGIENQFDSRFKNENDGFRNGTLDIRVFNNGQLTILRLGPNGVDIVSPGMMVFDCQQDMVFRSNGSMKFEAENIVMHSETSKRIINKFPNTTI